MDFEWVSTTGRLRTLSQQLASRSLLAVDTEFIRMDTFYPIPGLLQLADQEQAWLIDPLALPRPHELARLFYAETCTKVIHACFEDLEVIEILTRLRCRSVFDTQLAASYLNYGPQVGYQRLLHDELQIDIVKEESRSDWLQRPLSAEQIDYAVKDVEHLLPLYEHLRQRLQALGHWDKVLEDNRLLLSERQEINDPHLLYSQIPNAWKLNRSSLNVLRALCLWREQEAMQRDLPRNFLLRSTSLLPLAHALPSTKSQLAAIEGVTPRILRREGDAILKVIRTAAHDEPQRWPPLLLFPWPRSIKEVVEGMKNVVQKQAQWVGLPVDVLIKKRHYEEMLEFLLGVRQPSERWLGWRKEVVYNPLMAWLAPQRHELMQWLQSRQRQ